MRRLAQITISDPFSFDCTVDINKNYYQNNSFKIRTPRMNEEKFYTDVENTYSEFLSYEYDVLSACEKYRFFTKKIIETINNNTPKKNTSKIKNP